MHPKKIYRYTFTFIYYNEIIKFSLRYCGSIVYFYPERMIFRSCIQAAFFGKNGLFKAMVDQTEFRYC